MYDLARTIPDDVLRHGLGCLDKLAESGDECARTTRNNLRIMVFLYCPSSLFHFTLVAGKALGVTLLRSVLKKMLHQEFFL